jgi:hypothetical protein
MEAISPPWTWRKHRGADYPRNLRSPLCGHRRAAFLRSVDNVAQALAQLSVGSKSWFGRRETAKLPDLEYRTCATSSKADAKAAAQRMIGRRETYMSGAA